MLYQWNWALENITMEVLIQLPLDEYHLPRNITLSAYENFSLVRISYQYIKQSMEWYFYNNVVLNCKTAIKHKIDFTQSSNDFDLRREYIRYLEDYEENLNKIFCNCSLSQWY